MQGEQGIFGNLQTYCFGTNQQEIPSAAQDVPGQGPESEQRAGKFHRAPAV